MTENNIQNEIQDEEEENRIYEISFILDNHLNEDQALEKSQVLKDSILQKGGVFISEEAPYLRELAYTMIRVVNNIKVRFQEGYFGWIKFELDPVQILEIDKKLKLDEEVVRYLIVKTERGNDITTQDKMVFNSQNSIFMTAPAIETVEDFAGNIDTTILPEEPYKPQDSSFKTQEIQSQSPQPPEGV